MAYSYNPITWQFDFDSTWEFYSKDEVDNMVTNLNATIATKVPKNWVNWTFTSWTPTKTITVVDWQITSIV